MSKSSRRRWIQHMETMARPLLEAFGEGKLKETLVIERAENSSRPVDGAYLEAVGRLLNGLAPWLELEDLKGDEGQLQREFRALALRGLEFGTDPSHPDWLGFDANQQTLVDAAFLAQALVRAPKNLWEFLRPTAQDNTITALKMLRDRCPFSNNWLLFGAMPEAFLLGIREAYDPVRIDYALRQFEQWYVGDGFYRDGPHFHNDYYNSIVILPMMRDILEGVCPELKKYQVYLDQLVERQKRMASHLERMIAPDGSWPVVGRSITYRCGLFHALAQSALLKELPQAMKPASVRGALYATIQKSLGAENTYDEKGFLKVGLWGHQPGLGESYINTGSLYLASFAFLPLGLPEDADFWSEPDCPWTWCRVWNGEDQKADKALSD